MVVSRHGVLDTAIQVFFVHIQRVALDGRIKSGHGVTNQRFNVNWKHFRFARTQSRTQEIEKNKKSAVSSAPVAGPVQMTSADLVSTASESTPWPLVLASLSAQALAGELSPSATPISSAAEPQKGSVRRNRKKCQCGGAPQPLAMSAASSAASIRPPSLNFSIAASSAGDAPPAVSYPDAAALLSAWNTTCQAPPD